MSSSTYPLAGQAPDPLAPDPQVVVIGAGQAGLAVSHQLSALGVNQSSWSAAGLVSPGAIAGTASA